MNESPADCVLQGGTPGGVNIQPFPMEIYSPSSHLRKIPLLAVRLARWRPFCRCILLIVLIKTVKCYGRDKKSIRPKWMIWPPSQTLVLLPSGLALFVHTHTYELNSHCLKLDRLRMS